MAWTFYNSSGEAMIEDGAMTIANNTNNRVVTATGADPASLNGEANLTFSTDLSITSGNIVIATPGKGIDFSAQTGTASPGTVGSEILDHYEQGTFEPFFEDSSHSGDDGDGSSHTTQVGIYTRIGNVVNINLRIEINAVGSLSGGMFIGGLPFTARNLSNYNASLAVGAGTSLAITAGHAVTANIGSNQVFIDLNLWDAAAGITTLQIGELSAGGRLMIAGHYDVGV